MLVHGSWGDHHNWDAVVPALARTFQVFTYDRRGHSQSERLPTQGSIEEDEYVSVVTSFVQHAVADAVVTAANGDCHQSHRTAEAVTMVHARHDLANRLSTPANVPFAFDTADQ